MKHVSNLQKGLYTVLNTGKPAREPHVRGLPPAFKFLFHLAMGPQTSGLETQRLNTELI
jgi:hypothetical protein